MKILLDENISQTLRIDFSEHQLKTVQSLGWVGKKNGELLGLAAFNGFDVLITHDRNLKHQQNLKKFDITIIIILGKNNKDETIQPLLEKVKKLLKRKLSGGIIEVR